MFSLCAPDPDDIASLWGQAKSCVERAVVPLCVYHTLVFKHVTHHHLTPLLLLADKLGLGYNREEIKVTEEGIPLASLDVRPVR